MEFELKALAQKLNSLCHQALEAAAYACVARNGAQVTVEDLLLALLDHPDSDLTLIIQRSALSLDTFRTDLMRENAHQSQATTERPVLSDRLVVLLRDSWLLSSLDFGASSVRSAYLLITLLKSQRDWMSCGYAARLQSLKLASIISHFDNLTEGSAESAIGPETTTENAHPQSTQGAGALARFTTDFTALAEEGSLDPVFCREREIRQIVDILSRRRKNNPIIVGDAGVGKSAVIEGLALRIQQGEVPERLRDTRILGLDLGLLQAGASIKGEFERRLTEVLRELREAERPSILFIDEAHTLIGSGGPSGGSDAANLLKPALARGEIRAIGATTWGEYRQYFERDPALDRRFQPVKLAEPSIPDAITILRGLRPIYEQAHGVYIEDAALVAAAELSSRYISGRQLPDKAIDLLDTAAARVTIGLCSRPAPMETLQTRLHTLQRHLDSLERDLHSAMLSERQDMLDLEQEMSDVSHEIETLEQRWQSERERVGRLITLRESLTDTTDDVQREQLREELAGLLLTGNDEPLLSHAVTSATIREVIADWTGIPLGKMIDDEAVLLREFSSRVGIRVRGQDDAIQRIGDALQVAKAGLGAEHHPLGVFLLPGPSGVGKSETALAVADLLFGGEQALTTINMGEFQEAHSVARLIGSPPGYVGYGEGGVLSEAVRRRPYSVVLLDEVEKGHPDVLNLFYQVFDKGWLNDAQGRYIDFRNCVIFLTTNAGAELITDITREKESADLEHLSAQLYPILIKHFHPAILARMEILPYKPLSPVVLKAIVRSKLAEVEQRLRRSHGISLHVDDAVVDYIHERTQALESGARNIDAIIARDLLPGLAGHLYEARPNKADVLNILLNHQADGLRFRTSGPTPPNSVPNTASAAVTITP